MNISSLITDSWYGCVCSLAVHFCCVSKSMQGVCPHFALGAERLLDFYSQPPLLHKYDA